MEQCCQHPTTTQNDSNYEDVDKLKPASAGATEIENNASGFDCNICLDLVQDPIVTFCGHLYCWPCIYRWLQSQKASLDDPSQQPQCPVCKAEVTENTLIPLYGRGQSRKPSDSSPAQIQPLVPQRPNAPACGVHRSTNSHPHPHPHPGQHPSQQVHYQGDYGPHYSVGYYPPSSPAFGFAGTTTFHPMIGTFGEMIHARFFRNSQTTLLHTHPNTYSGFGSSTSSGRVRRQVMQAETSLSRVSFFLLCCIILCLLLF